MPSYKKTVAVAALAGLASAAPTNTTAGSFTIDQVKNENFKGYNVPLEMAKVFWKYGKPLPAGLAQTIANMTTAANTPGKKRSSGSATNTPVSGDVEWLTPVQIGTPAQTLNLDFDSGSSDLWVFSSETPSSSSRGHNKYTPNRSSTSKKMSGYSWSISYGDGSSASGDVYSDKVAIGGVSVSGQAVETASQVSSEFTQDSSDGLLGLAFSSINTVQPRSQKTWFDNVKSSLNQPLWTADLKHNEAGKYTFGTIDKSAYTGSLAYADVDNSQGFWMFTSSGYGIGNGRFTNSQFQGIADTGTTLTLLDDDVVNAYYGQISGADDSQGAWMFPCDANVPDFTFGVGSQKIVIPGEYINFENEGSSCYGGLQSNSGVGFSIFGDVALKSAFVVFDSNGPRIGWASKNLDGVSTGGDDGSDGGNDGGDGGNDGGDGSGSGSGGSCPWWNPYC